ncbi:MAG: hypothetical protein GY754_25655 [bacterium]|nr:hypothetical protein [bacterium]
MSKELTNLLNQLQSLGPIMPGKITEQYNVCGTPNCKCKRGKNPIKHGPYYQLSFTFNGKGRTLRIPKDKVDEINERNENYQKFKQLMNDFVELSIQQTREEVLNVKTKSNKND